MRLESVSLGFREQASLQRCLFNYIKLQKRDHYCLNVLFSSLKLFVLSSVRSLFKIDRSFIITAFLKFVHIIASSVHTYIFIGNIKKVKIKLRLHYLMNLSNLNK